LYEYVKGLAVDAQREKNGHVMKEAELLRGQQRRASKYVNTKFL
jgi:hypothetical protein